MVVTCPKRIQTGVHSPTYAPSKGVGLYIVFYDTASVLPVPSANNAAVLFLRMGQYKGPSRVLRKIVAHILRQWLECNPNLEHRSEYAPLLWA